MNKIELFNMDCMDYMGGLPDNAFDLAIVDPPYGIGESWKKDRKSKFNAHVSTYKNDQIPSAEYFKSLFRISKDQIIWGANYYTEYLPARNSWIVWDKNRNWNHSHLSEGELAWTSFNIPLRIAKFTWNGFVRCEQRSGIHPHEKPIGLYAWILHNYAKPEQKIIDTHFGSGSSAIAAHYFGCDFVGCEIDPDYYQLAQERFNEQTRQVAMF